MGARFKTILALCNPKLYADYAQDWPNTVAVIAAPFNRYLEGERPDASNWKIAVIAEGLTRNNRPFIGQWEHTNLFRHRAPVREYRRGGRGEWVKTHELMAWAAKEVAELQQGNRVVLVGHPHHVRRVGILARYYGLDPYTVTACERVCYDPYKRPGYQWWCSTPWFYIHWEYASRAALVLNVLLRKI